MSYPFRLPVGPFQVEIGEDQQSEGIYGVARPAEGDVGAEPDSDDADVDDVERR